MTTLLVFARTAREADDWARDLGLRPRAYAYVFSSTWLRGRNTGGVPRVFLPGFEHRSDSERLRAELAIADLTRSGGAAVRGVLELCDAEGLPQQERLDLAKDAIRELQGAGVSVCPT